MNTLNMNDYKTILKFYKKKIPKNNRLVKTQAEHLISNKLCRCIKKLDTTFKAKSIGICTKTIINNKGFRRGKITCKKTQNVELYKKPKNTTFRNNK